MDELIQKKDAIDAVLNGLLAWSHMPMWREQKILDMVRNVPSAQKWILCEERLPEKEGQYLVTLDFEWGKEIEMGDFFNGEWVNPNSHVTVAWMELPTPWKGEGE